MQRQLTESARRDGITTAWLSRYSERTRAAYMADLRDFAAFCDSVGLADHLAADREHLDAYKADMERRRLSPATVARRLSALSGLFQFAESQALIDRSPMAMVQRPKPAKRARTPSLDRDELGALLEAAAAAGLRDHALATLLALTDLRVTELCQADVRDLSAPDGRATMTIDRNGNGSVVLPLGDQAARAVGEYVGRRKSGPLLLENDGRGRLDRHDVARVVRRLAKAAGIGKRVTARSLRQSFVRLALDGGALESPRPGSENGAGRPAS